MPAKKKRKIKFAKVSHISLCPRGANQFQTLYKSDEASFSDIRQALQVKLTEQFSRPDTYLYIEDIFPSTVVFQVGEEKFRIGYSILEDGTAELENAEPTQVKETYVEVGTLTKAAADFDEQGILYSIAYAPNMVDSQGDFADQAAVDQMREYFMKNGEGVDISHSFDALSKDDVYISESFQVQPGDPRFSDLKDYKGNTVDATGAWAVAIKIESEELRQKYRDGEWNGVSIGGEYLVEEVEEDSQSLLTKCLNLLTGLTKQSHIEGKEEDSATEAEGKQETNKESDMNPEQMEALTKSIAAAVSAAITEANATVLDALQKAAPVEKPETLEKTEAPSAPSKEKKVVDLLSLEDVEALQKELIQEEVKKKVDLTDLASVTAYIADLKKSGLIEAPKTEELTKSEDGSVFSFLNPKSSAPMEKESDLFEEIDFDAAAEELGTGGI